MPIREFLRGGYQTLTESTLVMKHGHPMFTVIPQKKKVVPDGSKEEAGRSGDPRS
jgi:hypothetical protein